ncbi:unnamed protein product [Mytilus coruscus]|uniref:Uncharacterized protein n=1 Tax=Mytilus coruscus TaxID=42192 RepID=A0A6J7ZWT3_MYTCO|nr:unnamed protein product [Mytilus coruscus]
MIKFYLWYIIFQTVLFFNRFLCTGALACEHRWELRRGKCYRRIRGSSHTNGVVNGLLIMPKTAEENAIVMELLQLWGLNRMWIGLSNTNENNHFIWQDGTKLIDTGFTKWGSGEPNGGVDPMCVEALVCQQIEVIYSGKLTSYQETTFDITAKENESVTLTCGVKNIQAIASLFWTRSVNGTSVIVSQYAKGGHVTSPSLVFEHVKWTDEGLYKCHVTNIFGLTQTDETSLFVNASILTCSEGWNLHSSKCYKLDGGEMNISNSKKFCENLNAEMIMPKTADENSVLSE